MQPPELKTIEDFELRIGATVANYPDDVIAFRGQVSDRPLIPTMFRGGTVTSSSVPGCIPWLTANWGVCAERIVSEFRESKSNVVETQAIMQHYGYRSFIIDVTSDPAVALWFALHQFKSEKLPFFIKDELRSAVFQWSYYVPSSTGYVYLLKVPKSSDIAYVNLAQIMPADAARIHRQKAGAIICSRRSVSADNLLIAKFRISDDGWFCNSRLNARTNELFPLPSVDTFYRKLCTVPYYITPEIEMRNMKIGHPLLGIFPMYAESAKELFKEYAPLTRILQTHPALKWNVASGVVESNSERFKARNATRILVSRLMVDRISETISKTVAFQENALPSNNLIIEFEPEASLFIPSSKVLQEVLMGLWVIFGHNHIRIIEILDDFNDVHLGNECIYSIDELKFLKKKVKCTDHERNLKTILGMLYLLSTGTLSLSKVDQWYWQVKYRETE
jgi:hypothetical protein